MPISGLGSSTSTTRVSGGEGSTYVPVNPPTVTPPRVSGGEYTSTPPSTTTTTPRREPREFNPWLAWATWPLDVMRAWANLFWMPQPNRGGTPTRVRGTE